MYEAKLIPPFPFVLLGLEARGVYSCTPSIGQDKLK